jgi:hypothetical protein
MPDKACRRGKPLEGAVGFFALTFDYYQDVSRARIGSKMHLADIHQADAGVSQLALEDGFNLFAQGFAKALAVVLLATLFRHSALEVKTKENIRKWAWWLAVVVDLPSTPGLLTQKSRISQLPDRRMSVVLRRTLSGSPGHLKEATPWAGKRTLAQGGTRISSIRGAPESTAGRRGRQSPGQGHPSPVSIPSLNDTLD